MEVDIKIFGFILLFLSGTVFGEDADRCSYMTNIPRLPKPDDLPPIEFEGLNWDQRPFVPAPERDDLCMSSYIVNGRTQVIYIDEEIVGDIAIAKLNYKGDATPSIVRPLTSGSFNLLGPELRKENDEWILYITQRQDYETPSMRLYMFTIQIPGETSSSISLPIVNIDDNAPIIHISESCFVPELKEPYLTDCKYEVTDEDGEISTRFMRFEIESDRNDGETFYILGENIPSTWTSMTMTLGTNRTLDFEMNALHIFRVTALDSLPNTHTVTVMVQVQNVEHRPPRWVNIFAVQQFDEKSNQTFTVQAIDGDTGIDKPINYRIEVEERDKEFFAIQTIEGGRSGAIFTVFPIDRDELQREVFQLSIIAYKYDNETFSTRNNVVIIINDINDQAPLPLQEEPYDIEIAEETPQTLNFDTEFGFHDGDLGQHAQYEVRLESVRPLGAHEAFFIQPAVGYQRQTFIMGTTNHSMLDYEVPEFQNITLRVIATDMDDPRHVGVAIVNIYLKNWNDELPIFEHSSQTVSFNETEGAGFCVATVLATDRDIGDRVVHSLLGTAQNILSIDESTGDVTITANNSFDYHRQNELLVQVRAVDTLGEPYNTAISQLVIHLIDINNTPPTLRLPRGSPQVEENVPQGYQIVQEAQEITATDPDTSADLYFKIIWDTSYASKQGRATPPIEYHNCIDIETIYPDEDDHGNAIGRLVVKEIRPNITIDYEEFEVLYLTVQVIDRNTEIGIDFDELTYTITIIDMNDNAPQWTAGTLSQALRVRENSDSNTIIGSVQATDIDGPLYNQVRYTIVPRQDTPDNLVKIDFNSGQIEVDLNGAIDADTPPRHNLYYTVIASDKCSEDDLADCPPDNTYWDTEGNITIQIIDTNNKYPEAKTNLFNTTVYIKEDAKSGDEVVVIISEDLDRDKMYHTVSYQINYAFNPRLVNFFSVELDTGRIYVDYTTNEVLDRDGEEPTHRIFLNLIDNFYAEGDGNRNQDELEVLVVLLDVNDNAPELPSPEVLSWPISEGLVEGSKVTPLIYAPDRDEPNTNNSRVGYEITGLTIQNRDITVPQDLFSINHIFIDGNMYNVSAELETTKDLKGYWGTYDIGIRAFDHGEPQLDSEETYQIIISPYNFYMPFFVFPQRDATIRFARERAVVNGLLALVDGSFLDRIHATDDDGLEAGIVTFEVTGDEEAIQHFTVVNDGENKGTLMLKQLFTENVREFQIRIRATDGGTVPGPLSAEVSIRAVFVPTQGDPAFTDDTTVVAFVEREEGLKESHQLPLAEDPKNYLCEDDCYNIYYSIISGNSEDFFALDPENNILTLKKELYRADNEKYTLRISASNTRVGTSTAVLTVTVNVREANPQPYFVKKLYTAGISTLDTINRELFVVQATHTENEPIEYTIDMDSIKVDPSLTNVKETAFTLNRVSGALLLNMQPTASMHGMFEFNVLATDPAGAFDTAAVKVYLISSLNRVIFSFVNTLEQVEGHRSFIAQTFSTGFHMTCNVDQVVPAADDGGAARDDVTELRAHFVRDDEPVPTHVIEDLRSDTALLRSIQTTLNTELLVLRDFVTGASPELSAESGRVAVYALAALSAILGFACLVLFVAYLFRTRALNRRLQALSMTKYGSQESGLNRLALAAPGTNKHATEGSNPIWNETIKAPDFDALSEQSDDSDLIGIENLPQFRNDYFPDDEDSGQWPVNNNDSEVATHGNNFRFNPTPFSPEFANKPFHFK